MNYALQHGQTALMVAAYEGRVGVVRLLLERGADATRSACGMTAMGLALAKKHAAVVSVLEGRRLYDDYVSSGKMDDEEAIEGCDAGKKCCRDGLIMAGESAVVCEGCEIVVHCECAGRVRPPKDGKWTCRACKAKLKAKKKGDGAFGEGSTKKPAAKKPAATKKKPSQPPTKKAKKEVPSRRRRKKGPLVLLARALDPSKTGRPPTLYLACLGRNHPTWNDTPPVGVNYLPSRIGYPEGIEKTTTGHSMIRDTEPSDEGVYTSEKINYKKIDKPYTSHEKTGEFVHYRKVKESEVEAIMKKLDLD